MTKLKNSIYEKAPKLKLWQNSNCEKLKLWQNSKTQNVTKLKLWQIPKTQILTQFKTKIVTKLKLWQISIYEKKINFKQLFSNNILTPWQLMRYSLRNVLQFLRCFRYIFGSIRSITTKSRKKKNWSSCAENIWKYNINVEMWIKEWGGWGLAMWMITNIV